jgi:serine/threonine-protein kinase HipA
MKHLKLKYCPGTLAEGFETYSPKCLRTLFGGRRVSHFLQYEPPRKDDDVADLFLENRKRISISGVQEKLSLILEKNILRLTRKGEQGTFILKPIPGDLKKADQVPANEHLTMQIASQVYNIGTAMNAMIFFKDGTPAYLTRRFDVKDDGSKTGKDDFASLSGKTRDNAGPDFKYGSSYEECGFLIQRFVPAWRVEIEKFFSLVVFNFLFSNGDAHLKNFSLLESSQGDYFLSPAYDLVNTRMHADDSYFALDKGLFANGFRSARSKKTGHPSKADFKELARRIGVHESRIEKLLHPFLQDQYAVQTLISRSFLNEPAKRGYLQMYNTRRNMIIT